MNSICLSAAPNLRCEGLTRTESIVLLVPPAIELVFSITLALTSPPDRGTKHWLLVLDGVLFLILALLDFLSHIITQASSTLVIFKIIDFVLAAASFLPIIAYTFFLFLFARTNLVSFLPSRFRRVIGFALFAIIPFTIVFNELGSLLGISHRVVLSQQTPILAVGFSDANLQRIALFFSAGTLALLTLFQFALFSLAFIRLVRAFLDERRVEATNGRPGAPDEIHLFRGLGWLAGGLKLGAIESIVGFVNVSFGTALTRRVLRLFSRGALIIGVIKGMNLVEDFVRFESDMRARRSGSKRMSKRISRLFISNPRNSTFREMSPQASSFHAAQREKRAGRHGPSPLALGANSTHHSFDPGGRKERVTVVYDGKTPPVLQMRFSFLDMPDIPVPALPPPVVLPTITEVAETPRDTANPFDSGSLLGRHSKDSVFHVTGDGSSKSLPITSERTHSVASDSLDAMREITSRFPGLPPRVIPGKSSLAPPDAVLDSDEEWRTMARSRSLQRRYENQTTAAAPSTSTVSPVNSIKRKPAPRPTTPLEPEARPPSLDMGRVHDYEQEPEYASVLAQSPVSLSSSDRDSYYSNHTTPGLTRVSTLDTAPTTPGLGAYVERPVGRLANRVIAMEGKMAETRQADAEEKQRERLMRLRRELRAPDARRDEDEDDATVELPWMQNDPLSDLQTPPGGRRYPLAPSDVDDDEVALDNAWRSAGLTRIKSVSTVRVHTTPVAEQMPELRASLFAVEEEDLAGSYEAPSMLAESPVMHARLESGVLGEEDKRLVRQGFYV